MRTNTIKTFFSSMLVFFFIPFAVFGLSGKVIGITDGDSFVLLTEDKKQLKIRLYGIDCPEKEQAFGNKAKQFISNLIFGKEVEVVVKTIDRYGRTVGTVIFNELNVNQTMVEFGYAWWYEQYAPTDTILPKLEEFARTKHLGLWVDHNPIAPWEFRHGSQNRAFKQATNTITPSNPVFTTVVDFNTQTFKYHCPTCQWALRCTKNCIKIDLQDAQNRGGIPCKVCNGTCR